jgi:hypothetical protein
VSGKKLLALLKGGDRRSIGRSDELAALVAARPALFAQLIAGLWDPDALVRMRAADAAEKVTRKQPNLLQPHKAESLGLLLETHEQEIRWHLAAMIPRLSLTAHERRRAASSLLAYLDDKSSIVKTFALQGLFDLSESDSQLRASVVDLLHQYARSGTPAMKARCRNLLARLDSRKKKPDGRS